MRTIIRPHLNRKLIGTIVAAASLAVAPSAMAGTRSDKVCQTISGVYQVCLSGASSYNGHSASGYVSGVSCETLAPGEFAGYFCGSGVPQGRNWGAYYNSQLGAWEEWLNQEVNYLSPLAIYSEKNTTCVYLRIDVRPNGQATYQNFRRTMLPFLTQC